jgi:hypothetical protein
MSSTTCYYSTDHLVLNIGLKRADTGELINYLFVENSLRDMGLDVRDFKLFQSDSEPTAVVVVRAIAWAPMATEPDASQRYLEPDVSQRYFATREIQNKAVPLFKQDAVAIYDPEFRFGYLVGPKADVWGPFNPAFFLMPDGRRLSQHNL